VFATREHPAGAFGAVGFDSVLLHIVKEGLFDAIARDSTNDVARKRKYEVDKRMLETRVRVEVRREKEQREWAKNVKKYDEIEALRRLREERETQKELDQLSSFELEKLRIEKKHDDSKIKMKIDFRVNKRLEWTHIAIIQTISEFNIWAFEQLFNDEFDKRDDSKN